MNLALTIAKSYEISMATYTQQLYSFQCYMMCTWQHSQFFGSFVLSSYIHTTIWFNYVQQNYAKCIWYTKHQTKKKKQTLFRMEQINYIDGVELKRVDYISCTRPNTHTHTTYFDYIQLLKLDMCLTSGNIAIPWNANWFSIAWGNGKLALNSIDCQVEAFVRIKYILDTIGKC